MTADTDAPVATPELKSRVLVLATCGLVPQQVVQVREVAQRVFSQRGFRLEPRTEEIPDEGICVVSKEAAQHYFLTQGKANAVRATRRLMIVVGADMAALGPHAWSDSFCIADPLDVRDLELCFDAALRLIQARTRLEAEFADRASTLVLASEEWQKLLVAHAELEERLKKQNALFGAIFDTVVDGVITIDGRGRIELFNPAAQRLFGYETQEVIGKSVNLLMRAEDAAHHDGYVRSYLDTGQARIIGVGGREVICRRKDGSIFDAELSVAEARVGATRRFTGIIRDISQRKAMQRELAESQVRLARQNAALVSLGTRKDTGTETLTDALTVICGVCRVALDIDQVSVWFTDADQACLKRVAGWPDYGIGPKELGAKDAEPLLAQLDAEGVMTCNGRAGPSPCAALTDAGRAEAKASLCAPIRSKSGTVGVFHCAAERERDWMLDECNFVGFLADQVALALERDRALRAEQEVRDRERRLAQAQHIARLGDWQWDMERDEFVGSEEFFRLVGHEKNASLAHLADFVAVVHPDCRTDVARAIEVCAQDAAPYHGDFSILRPDGTVRHVHGQMVTVVSTDTARRFVRGTLLDITERKAAEQAVLEMRDTLQDKVNEQTRDLIEARDEALAAERTMSAFLANMSHEIRTPLHAILSYARFGLKHTVQGTDEDSHGYFEEIEDSGEDLLGLLNDLLDLSKLKAGKMAYESVSFKVKELADKVVAQFGPAAQEKKINLLVVGVDGNLTVQADKNKLAQVLRNLLSNAIKFSPEGELVRLTAKTTDGEQLLITVTDNGPGIPESELAGIFDPFVQSSKTKSKSGGTGLGLAICKEIVENGHRGRIYAENNSTGGASFHVVLPLAQHH